MPKIGQRNRLEIVRDSPQGPYVDGESLGEILLPAFQRPDWAEIGDVLDIFLYRDSEDRLVATTRTPKAMVGEFACLEVTDVNPKVGAFLDWGLEKDILLPFREQKTRVQVGNKTIVYLKLDPETDRLVATARFHRYLDQTEHHYRKGDPVKLLVIEETPIGYRAIIENAHTGLLYKSELSGPIEYGQSFTGFIKEVREDGKIDLQRDPSGYGRTLPLAEDIYDRLLDAGGYLPFNDKSPPEKIRATFFASKKAFKQALGMLYKQRRIEFKDDGIAATGSDAN
ncbi:MAG TPA: GntR family transcriptional regulator [Opitutae bacterium]|nr:GntR family transcriptional regulator [Opitutaceae bacterium]HCR30245.1 GntR family transcriptional regulator [Opitutae bacterium]